MILLDESPGSSIVLTRRGRASERERGKQRERESGGRERGREGERERGREGDRDREGERFGLNQKNSMHVI